MRNIRLGVAGALGLVVLGAATSARADLYYNSSEPGCDGSDPSILWCDDFEDGDWVVKNCDEANASGGLEQTDGWCGTIYYVADPEGTHFGRCGSRGAAGTDCAAGSGPRDGKSNGMMGDHDFAGQQLVDELWFRYYLKPLAGSTYGAQKMLTINHGYAGVGGIYFGGVGSCLACSSPHPVAELSVVPQYDAIFYDNDPTAYDTKVWRQQNLGNDLFVSPGKWHYVEYHVKLNTPGQADGVWELWVDDCGEDGLGCTGEGTQRSKHTDVQWVKPGDDSKIGSLWLENWANPQSTGEEYYDQIVVAKHRVGPMGSTIAPGDGGRGGTSSGGTSSGGTSSAGTSNGGTSSGGMSSAGASGNAATDATESDSGCSMSTRTPNGFVPIGLALAAFAFTRRARRSDSRKLRSLSRRRRSRTLSS